MWFSQSSMVKSSFQMPTSVSELYILDKGMRREQNILA